ncbi:MAG: hypothetical protein ACPLZF_03910 [Nitrososphaeria archaeon]
MTVDGISVLEPAFKFKAVDTMGAGDGWNAVGAFVITKHGAITALPYKSELNMF